MINYELKLKTEYKSLIDFTHDLEKSNENVTSTTTHKETITKFNSLLEKTKIEGTKTKITCGEFRIITIVRKLENNNFKLSIIMAKFNKEGIFEGGSFETLLIKEKRKTELELFEELF